VGGAGAAVAAAAVGDGGAVVGAGAEGAPPQAASTIAPASRATIQDQIRCWFTLISSSDPQKRTAPRNLSSTGCLLAGCATNGTTAIGAA